MPRQMKDCWINKQDPADLYSLSIESANVLEEYAKIKVWDSTFPETPTEKHPLRHTLVINFLSYNDLVDLYNCIGKVLYEN